MLIFPQIYKVNIVEIISQDAPVCSELVGDLMSHPKEPMLQLLVVSHRAGDEAMILTRGLTEALWCLAVVFVWQTPVSLQDYVDVESPQLLVKDEAEYHEAKSLRVASVSEEEKNTV